MDPPTPPSPGHAARAQFCSCHGPASGVFYRMGRLDKSQPDPWVAPVLPLLSSCLVGPASPSLNATV